MILWGAISYSKWDLAIVCFNILIVFVQHLRTDTWRFAQDWILVVWIKCQKYRGKTPDTVIGKIWFIGRYDRRIGKRPFELIQLFHGIDGYVTDTELSFEFFTVKIKDEVIPGYEQDRQVWLQKIVPDRVILFDDPASSIKSIALSGRKRSLK